MKISQLGAKDCITGSYHLIENNLGLAGNVNMLIDCDTAYGDAKLPPFEQFPVSQNKINYLFLIHAHVDQICRVPDLVDAGFRGEIICTQLLRRCSCPCSTMACLFPTEHTKMSSVWKPLFMNWLGAGTRELIY